MSAYSLTEGRLTIDENIVFPRSTVKQVLEFNGMLFILLSLTKELDSDRNIYATDLKGNIIWQVQEPKDGTKNARPFTHIDLKNNHELTGYNYNGITYLINKGNGRIENTINFGR